MLAALSAASCAVLFLQTLQFCLVIFAPTNSSLSICNLAHNFHSSSLACPRQPHAACSRVPASAAPRSGGGAHASNPKCRACFPTLVSSAQRLLMQPGAITARRPRPTPLLLQHQRPRPWPRLPSEHHATQNKNGETGFTCEGEARGCDGMRSTQQGSRPAACVLCRSCPGRSWTPGARGWSTRCRR